MLGYVRTVLVFAMVSGNVECLRSEEEEWSYSSVLYSGGGRGAVNTDNQYHLPLSWPAYVITRHRDKEVGEAGQGHQPADVSVITCIVNSFTSWEPSDSILSRNSDVACLLDWITNLTDCLLHIAYSDSLIKEPNPCLPRAPVRR